MYNVAANVATLCIPGLGVCPAIFHNTVCRPAGSMSVAASL